MITNNNNSIYFIAEFGQNHQGSLAIAKKMVDSLKLLNVSAIKTAKRDIDTCLTSAQKSMIYDNPNSFGRTYYDHRKALELSKDDFKAFKEYTEASGFDFISSFTDINSLDFLVDIGVSTLKIASQRLVDVKLLNEAAKTKLPIIISTGMSTLKDIETALHILKDNEKYLLQCSSIYPCQEEDLNLNVLKTYQTLYKDLVNGFGFSGHHSGVAPDIVAYLLGAKIIERHYTLDRTMKGTDHAGSLEYRGIELVLKYIEQAKQSLGNKNKMILEKEKPVIKKLRGDLL